MDEVLANPHSYDGNHCGLGLVCAERFRIPFGVLTIRTALLCSFLLLLFGCATAPTEHKSIVYVDSLLSPTAEPYQNFVVLSGNKNAAQEELEFQELQQYVVRALESRGFSKVESAQDANIAIVVFHGIGDSATIENTRTLPIWGQVGGESSYSSGVAEVNGSTIRYRQQTHVRPRLGVTNYVTQSRTYTNFEHYAQIRAYDLVEFQKSGKEVELWRTTVNTWYGAQDLRRIFPMLIGAAMPFFQKDSEGKVHVIIGDSDESVRTLKQIDH